MNLSFKNPRNLHFLMRIRTDRTIVRNLICRSTSQQVSCSGSTQFCVKSYTTPSLHLKGLPRSIYAHAKERSNVSSIVQKDGYYFIYIDHFLYKNVLTHISCKIIQSCFEKEMIHMDHQTFI